MFSSIHNGIRKFSDKEGTSCPLDLIPFLPQQSNQMTHLALFLCPFEYITAISLKDTVLLSREIKEMNLCQNNTKSIS